MLSGETKRVLLLAERYPPCDAWPTASRRLAHLARGLESHGWEVSVVAARFAPQLCACDGCRGVTSLDPATTIPPAAVVDVRPGRLFSGDDTKRAAALRVFAPELETTWALGAYRAACRIIRRHPVDVVWTSSPPPGSASAGFLLQRTFRVPWVAELRDPIIQADDMSALRTRGRRLWTRRHGFVVRRADRVVEVAPDRAERDAELLGVVPDVVPSPIDLPDDWTTDPPDEGATTFDIVFAGAIYEDRGPAEFFDALRAFLAADATRRRDVRFLYYGRHGDAVLAAARHAGAEVQHVCSDVGFRPRGDVLEAMARAQLLLLLTSSVGGGAKAWEYLATGRPMLATPGGDAWTNELVDMSPAVHVASTPAAVAQALATAYGRWRSSGHQPSVKVDLSGMSATERAAQLAKILESVMLPPAGDALGAGGRRG